MELDNVKAGDEVILWRHGGEFDKPVFTSVLRTTAASVWVKSGDSERRFNRDGSEHGSKGDHYSRYYTRLYAKTDANVLNMNARIASVGERIRQGKLRNEWREVIVSSLSVSQLERILAIARGEVKS